MKKSEITEIDSLCNQVIENHLRYSFVIFMACNKVNIRDVKHQVPVLRILPEKVEIALLYAV